MNFFLIQYFEEELPPLSPQRKRPYIQTGLLPTWTILSPSAWKWKWRDIWPSMLPHTRNLCSAFNPSKVHTQQWTHTHTVGSHLCCGARGAVGGSVPCSRAPQSWRVQRALYHSPPHLQFLPDRDSNLQPFDYESDSLTISLNNLELNTLKTVEMTVDFRRNPPALPPLTIMNHTAVLFRFRFWAPQFLRTRSGTIILSPWWKTHSRGYTSFASWGSSTCQELLKQFYSAIIESVLCTVAGVYL